MGYVSIPCVYDLALAHVCLVDQPLFHVPAYVLVSPLEFGIYGVLGVVGGLGSVFFVKALLNLRIWFRRLPQSTVWLQPVVGGLLVGLFGWFVPEVLGVGYDFIDRVLSGDFPLKTVVLLGVLKLIATPVCYSSGNAGGIFGPSLFIGAMMGGAVGSIAHWWFPAITANPGAYALVGMGTAFAGIVRTPLTSVITIFEMTRDYSIIVPLMISNLISFFISQSLQHEPIYEALALQEGVYLPTAELRQGSAGKRLREIMDTSAEMLSLDVDLDTVRRTFALEKCTSWPVGEDGVLRAVVTRRELEASPSAHSIRDVIETSSEYPFAHHDHPIGHALEIMRAAGVDTLPVVSRTNIGKMAGLVTLRGILADYGVEEIG